MIGIKRLTIAVALVMTAWAWAAAQTDPGQTERRADRSFEGEEWASAGALYGIVLDRRPDDARVTARAVISAFMNGDSTAMPVHLVESAMAHGVSLQQVMGYVERESFEMGRAWLYPAFLRSMHEGFPYMKRAIDDYLLQYYLFRNDGPMIVRYARAMLAGLDTSTKYLMDLATGQLLCGDDESAVATWKRVLELDPRSFEAASALAAWYDGNGQRQNALDYYRMAYALRATPFVAQRIADLEKR